MAEKQVIGKTMFYIVVAVLAVGIIWVYTIANNANNQASQNAAAVQIPEYDLSYVAGGPERFSEDFTTATEEAENVNPGNYLWSTVILENNGESDAEEVELNITAAIPVRSVYFSTTDRFVDAEVSETEEPKVVTINMESLDAEESFKVFLGMNPPEYSRPFDLKKWANEYQTYLEKISIESDQASASLYMPGYAALYE